MISRAKKVWMLVDTRTEGMVSGEESRYIKQLEYHFGIPVKRYSVQFDHMKTAELTEIPKTAEDIDIIKELTLSASSLKNYLDCPAKFYYGSVRKLKSEDEVAESLDVAMIGTVFHAVMFEIYASAYDGKVNRGRDGRCWIGMLEQPYKVSKAHLAGWKADEDKIGKMVMSMIAQTMKTDQVSGRNLVIADVIIKYCIKTLERDIEYLEASNVDSLLIYGLEVPVETMVGQHKVKGLIDRLDSVRDGEIRVVDYKTGKVNKSDYDITDKNYNKIVSDIFAVDKSERPSIAFQFLVYDMLLKQNGYDKNRQMKNAIYSTAAIFKEVPQTRDVNENFYQEALTQLQELLRQMTDPQEPFRRTELQKSCSYCDFRNICGK